MAGLAPRGRGSGREEAELPGQAEVVAEGQRRHRDGARLAVARIAELGGLAPDLAPERAAALIAIATTHEAWRELCGAYRLSWDEAETLLCGMLTRAVLARPARESAAQRPRPGRPPPKRPPLAS